MATFYAPEIEKTLTLPEEESMHCARVLRLQAGDSVEVIDGVGGLFHCEIVTPHPKHTEVRIVEREYAKPPVCKVHIAIAPTKNIDRSEWMVEKATEIGIAEITPLLCRFSERKNINTERLRKIAISTTKQSKHIYLPKVNDLTPIDTFIKNNNDEVRFIAHCYEQKKEELFRVCPRAGSVVVMVGPEGDFSTEEVETALAHGFRPVTLGESRLRTETAGIVACHIVNLRQETL